MGEFEITLLEVLKEINKELQSIRKTLEPRGYDIAINGQSLVDNLVSPIHSRDSSVRE